MIEIEKTYLAKKLPEDLKTCRYKEIIDIYIPKEEYHPVLRIRKIGNTYEITKKQPIEGKDSSNQEEQTIKLNEKEYNCLSKLPGKRIHKIRYYYNYKNRILEFNIFKESLSGLVTIEVEFNSIEEKDSFEMPEFCLVDVTHEEFIAGGLLCGKSYEDIKDNLEKFNYKKIELKEIQ